MYSPQNTSRGVTEAAILQASQKLSGVLEGFIPESGAFASPQAAGLRSTDVQNVGVRCNQWRRPVTEYGSNNPDWEVRLKGSPFVGNIDFDRKSWAEARETVDTILDLLFDEFRLAADKYEGLVIERYVRQGSSREGIKVIAADEFDTLLLYNIQGVYLDDRRIETESGKEIPEYCKVTCNRSLETMRSRCPRLFQKGVFKQLRDDTVVLSSRALHQQVFQSIIDQSVDSIKTKLSNLEVRGHQLTFRISRKMNAPSINLTIHNLVHNTAIDVDVVPGIRLRNDQVPDPARPGWTMDCPVYAVFKWTEESSLKASKFNDTEVIWRVCSSGYEKHTADVARCNQQQRYIITALRILKTYFSKTKASGNTTPPQIVTVLRSYHLKHIAFYIILHTQYISRIVLHGVEDALQYFFRFLRVSLEKKRLPHFFHSNTYARHMYPNYSVKENALRFNLLGTKSGESLNQALLSLDQHLIPNLGFHSGGEDDPAREQVVAKYQQHVSVGDYF